MLSISLPLLLSLVGCGGDAAVTDLPPEPPPGTPGTPPVANAAPPPAGDGAQAPTDGAAPPQGNPVGARPIPAGFVLEPGKTVKISGTTTYNGTQTGVLRLDFLRQPEGAPFPELLHTISLPKPGPWEIEVPRNTGDVTIAAYIDANDNGPEPTEPGAVTDGPVKVAAESVRGITLDIVDNPARDARKPPADKDLNGGAEASPTGPPVVGDKPGGNPGDAPKAAGK